MNFKGHRPRSSPEYHERPKKIKITKTPPGDLPENIREQWVGVVIPVAPLDERLRYATGVELGEPQNQDGFEVLATEAIAALQKKCEELLENGDNAAYEKAHQAWQVWLNSFWNREGIRLEFKRDCCTVVE